MRYHRARSLGIHGALAGLFAIVLLTDRSLLGESIPRTPRSWEEWRLNYAVDRPQAFCRNDEVRL